MIMMGVLSVNRRDDYGEDMLLVYWSVLLMRCEGDSAIMGKGYGGGC